VLFFRLDQTSPIKSRSPTQLKLLLHHHDQAKMACASLRKQARKPKSEPSEYIDAMGGSEYGYRHRLQELNCWYISTSTVTATPHEYRLRAYVQTTPSQQLRLLEQAMLSSGSGSGSSPPRPPPDGLGFGGGSQPPTPSRVWPFNYSFERPLLSLAAQRHPDREHYIVMDRTQGYIRTTVADARQYADLGKYIPRYFLQLA